MRTRKKKILPYPVLRKDNKEDQKKDLGNHCLISLTLVLGKGMEQLILETISKHCKEKKVVSHSQVWVFKRMLCLTSVMAFYGEVTGLVDETG